MKKPVLILAVGMCVGALGTSEAAQSVAARVFGAFASHKTEELYDISVGATPAGNDVRVKRQRELRDTVVVPAHYGSVVAVTPSEGVAVVWYQSDQGVLRNVLVSDPDAYLYRLEQRTTTRREIRLLR